MSKELARRPSSEVAPKSVRKLMAVATEHWTAIKTNSLKFCVDLRRLQDANAHELHGQTNFGSWAASEWDDLEPNLARKLSAQGRILLLLDEHGRINLEKESTYPGVSGIRALASIEARLGTDTMLRVFDACKGNVTSTAVNAACRLLMQPEPVPRRLPEQIPQPEFKPEEFAEGWYSSIIEVTGEIADDAERLREMDEATGRKYIPVLIDRLNVARLTLEHTYKGDDNGKKTKGST